MQASGAPMKIYVPFAVSGTKNTIPIDSQVGITPGAASFDTGFPPLTFTPVSAGGVPPAGADFNGILNAITAIQQFQSGGGIYPYDATWSSDNGGYPIGAILVRADGTGFWLSTEDNNATDPETDTSGAWIPINNRESHCLCNTCCRRYANRRKLSPLFDVSRRVFPPSCCRSAAIGPLA